jgi:hypothetical protein
MAYRPTTFTWRPGWVEAPVGRQRTVIQSICRELNGSWTPRTASGSTNRSAEPNWPSACYPRWPSRQRQVRSMLARLIDGRLICNGTAEPFGSLSGGIPSISCTSRLFSRNTNASGSG